MSGKGLSVALVVLVALLALLLLFDPWALWRLSYHAKRLLMAVGIVAVAGFVIHRLVGKK